MNARSLTVKQVADAFGLTGADRLALYRLLPPWTLPDPNPFPRIRLFGRR